MLGVNPRLGASVRADVMANSNRGNLEMVTYGRLEVYSAGTVKKTEENKKIDLETDNNLDSYSCDDIYTISEKEDIEKGPVKRITRRRPN